MNWSIDVFKKYAVLTGRARRREFWPFYLANLGIGLAVALSGGRAGRPAEDEMGIVLALFLLAIFLPTLAVSARRLHDTGRSEWWLLFGLVPFVGPLVVLAFLLQDSQPGDNAYGPCPKTGDEFFLRQAARNAGRRG